MGKIPISSLTQASSISTAEASMSIFPMDCFIPNSQREAMLIYIKIISYRVKSVSEDPQFFFCQMSELFLLQFSTDTAESKRFIMRFPTMPFSYSLCRDGSMIDSMIVILGSLLILLGGICWYLFTAPVTVFQNSIIAINM